MSGQFLRVERDLLHSGGVGRNARETRDPRCTAEFASAGSDTADASGLLTGSDLFHLDADVEPFGEDLDQLAEIDPLVGDVVEDRLDFVALVLYVADLHVEPHLGCDLTRGDHCLVFEGNGLLPTLDVVGFGQAVDLLEFAVVGVESNAPHLLGYHVARQGDDADIVAGRCLHGDDVAPFERQVIDVLIVGTAGVFETDFENIGRNVIWIGFHPGRFMQFEASLAGLYRSAFRCFGERASTSHLRLGCFRIFGVLHRVFVFHEGVAFQG